MLKIENVVSGYGEVSVLQDISFEVGHEVFAILGANGAGKTTLMKTIAKAIPLMSGSMSFEGEDIAGETSYEVAARGIAFVPQEHNVFPTLTVLENLSVGSTLLDKARKNEKIEEVLNTFPALKAISKQKAGSLSGGEAQMVAVGRALMQEPKLLLLDEPSAGLSPLYVDMLFSKIADIHKEHKVSVLVAEQNAVKTLRVANKALILTLGKIHMIEDADKLDESVIKEGYNI
ncbi:MAG: ABC transporter ATP-binding protein [Oscillospiraceae bacterium]|nr:ABC transporter ATP-binding protein [Oscillospiraceae bacterium]